jgi:hypothetical protein
MRPRWAEAEIEQQRPWLKNEMYDFDEHPDVVKQWGVDKNAEDETKGMTTFLWAILGTVVLSLLLF